MPDQQEMSPRRIAPMVAEGAQAAIKPVNYIIAIGIDKYDSPVVDDFYNNNCQKDRDDLVNCLLSDYEGFEVFRLLKNEEATKENIEKAINDFVNDKKHFNRVENNLLIFYSGHGTMVKIGRSGTVGCWVPYQCQQLEHQDVVAYNKLTDLIRDVITKNFLIIVDACNASSLLDGNRPDAANNMAGKSPDFLPSKWALVSSRSDEPARTGGPNKNSAFTAALLESLKNNAEAYLLVNDIGAYIARRFYDDDSQLPQYDRLQFPDEINTGSFRFHLRDTAAERRNIREILETGLAMLNYEDQYKSFNSFELSSKQFAVFSGTPSCGIRFLLHQVKEQYFPSDMDYRPAASFGDAVGAEDVACQLFRSALGQEWSDEGSLQNYIAGLLADNHTVFEFIFYNEGGRLVPDVQKKDILDALGEFVAKIPDSGSGNHLVILIVDLENFDYLRHYQNKELNGIPALFVPQVASLKEESLIDWLDGVKRSNVPQYFKLAQFEAMFKLRLLNRLPALLEESGRSPGQALRLICKYAECDELLLKMDI